MAVDWEQFQKDAEAAAERAKAEVAAKIQEIEDVYKAKFAEAQSAALSERADDVGPGETKEQLQARIAQVPGSFSDNAESATQVVTAPHVQAVVAAQQGVAAAVAAPPAAKPPGASEAQSTVITPAPVSDQPEPEPVVETPAPEAQPDQPTPEPTVEPEQTPEPEAQAPVEEQPAVEPVVEVAPEVTPEAPVEAEVPAETPAPEATPAA
jgi:ribonuclease E